MLIALTGGIGAGKSTVAQIWESRGANIVDADVIARQVVEPGQPGLEAIKREFGPQILTPQGELDRQFLASLVFNNSQARLKLERILHPLIQQAAMSQISSLKGVVVYVIPLLVESNSPLKFDAVVNIRVPEDVRMERLVRERGLTLSEARSRINSQATEGERSAVATHELEGDCAIDQLRSRAALLYEELTHKKEAD